MANTGDGLDLIESGAGADTINAGAGDDVLIGGDGIDKLTGGGGNDRFRFEATTNSGPLMSNSDIIYDFQDGGGFEDILDLSNIDANTLLAGNQSFFFDDHDGIVEAGELFILFTNDPLQGGAPVTFISADVNGNGVADFGLRLNGTFILDATDIVL